MLTADALHGRHDDDHAFTSAGQVADQGGAATCPARVQAPDCCAGAGAVPGFGAHAGVPNEKLIPGVRTSLCLIAVGAILRYAVTVTAYRVSLTAVDLIMLIAGGVGLVIALTSTAPHRRGVDSTRSRVEQSTIAGTADAVLG